MAKSTRSTAIAMAAAMAPTEGRAAIAMTGGGRIDNLSTWVFLWEGITVPIKFEPSVPPPPPEP